MDEQQISQQFWLRVVLAIGLLWGTLLLVELLAFLITATNYGAPLDLIAHLSNSLTLAPVCFLAFWRRRMACVWLVFNGLLVAASVVGSVLRTHQVSPVSLVVAAVSVLLTIFLVTTEIRRWPGALAK